MAERFYVTPRPGLSLRDPGSLEILPALGDWKHNRTAWQRIAAVGDCVLSDKPLTKAEYKKAFGQDPPPEPQPDESAAAKEA